MPFIATKAAGTSFAFPDVCNVPTSNGPIPIPFVNVGKCTDAEDTISEVRIEGAEVIVESSVIPTSTGDEPGSAGGVKSGTICGPVRFKSASAKVYAKGKRVVLLGAETSHNNDNALGQLREPSQSKVEVSS